MSNPKVRAMFDGTHIILGIFHENGEHVVLTSQADSNGYPAPLEGGQQIFEEVSDPDVHAEVLHSLLMEEMNS